MHIIPFLLLYNTFHNNLKDIKVMERKIYQEDNFINSNIPFMFNRRIVEFDMKEAGFSLCKEYKLLPSDVLTKLSRYRKDRRNVEIGNLQRNNKDFNKNLRLAFEYARKLFFDANALDQTDIISIKKDAIFTFHPEKITKEQFGEHILFREKNQYSAYIQLEKRLEIYYHPEYVDIKGINTENCNLHMDYMIDFIRKFCKHMETSTDEKTMDFIRRFATSYKLNKLDVGYYREFNANSKFVDLDGNKYSVYDDPQYLNKSYNFEHVILKLAKIPL